MYDQIISLRTISSSIEMPESGYNNTGIPHVRGPSLSPPPPDMDIFKLIQLGPHCTGTLRRHVQTCSLWRTHLASYWNAFLFYLTLMYDKFESCGFRILLPSATKLRKLCFYTCLSFCSQGGAIPACIAGGMTASLAAGLQGGLLQGDACSRGGDCSWGGSCS